MKFFGRVLLIAMAALLLTELAFGQEEDQFMSEAAQDGMAKVQWALMALQISQNGQVKAFAQQVLADYTQSQNDLVFIANQHGILLPRDLNPKDRAAADALSKLEGAEFDKAYMKAMLNGRQAELSKFKQQAAQANIPGMMDWANQTLPALQSDLKEAQKIAPVVGVKPTATSKEQSGSSASQPKQPSTASQNPY